MNWSNLQKNACPYCNGVLRKPDTKGIVRCDHCNFRIEEPRMMSIRDNRRQNITSTIKMRWQNLKKDKCPLCGDDLTPNQGQYAVLRCMKTECNFHIRVDRLTEILGDKEHPANRFA